MMPKFLFHLRCSEPVFTLSTTYVLLCNKLHKFSIKMAVPSKIKRYSTKQTILELHKHADNSREQFSVFTESIDWYSSLAPWALCSIIKVGAVFIRIAITFCIPSPEPWCAQCLQTTTKSWSAFEHYFLSFPLKTDFIFDSSSFFYTFSIILKHKMTCRLPRGSQHSSTQLLSKALKLKSLTIAYFRMASNLYTFHNT